MANQIINVSKQCKSINTLTYRAIDDDDTKPNQENYLVLHSQQPKSCFLHFNFRRIN